MLPRRASPGFLWQWPTSSRGMELDDGIGLLRQWRPAGAGRKVSAQRWNFAGVGSLLSRGRRALADLADAPAVRTRHRLDRGLCASRVVCAAWLPRRNSGCAWARWL